MHHACNEARSSTKEVARAAALMQNQSLVSCKYGRKPILPEESLPWQRWRETSCAPSQGDCLVGTTRGDYEYLSDYLSCIVNQGTFGHHGGTAAFG